MHRSGSDKSLAQYEREVLLADRERKIKVDSVTDTEWIIGKMEKGGGELLRGLSRVSLDVQVPHCNTLQYTATHCNNDNCHPRASLGLQVRHDKIMAHPYVV